MNEMYTRNDMTDMPYVTITVQDGRTVKRITHYYGDHSAPKSLYLMEEKVDEIAGTDHWIGTGGKGENSEEFW